MLLLMYIMSKKKKKHHSTPSDVKRIKELWNAYGSQQANPSRYNVHTSKTQVRIWGEWNKYFVSNNVAFHMALD